MKSFSNHPQNNTMSKLQASTKLLYLIGRSVAIQPTKEYIFHASAASH